MEHQHLNLEDIAPSIRNYFSERNILLKGPFPLAGSAGSGRRFFRIAASEMSWIVAVSSASDPEFGRFVEYGRFFTSLGLPVPTQLLADETEFQILEEDLGDLHLEDAIRTEDNPTALYHKAVELLVHFQKEATTAAERCPALAEWQFGRDDLRWETEYFRANFLERHAGWPRKKEDDLDVAFDLLAQRVAGQPRQVMHRDYQSQNIMVRGGNLFMVDFQGSRIGSVYYDIAALLWDPYVSLSLPVIKELFEAYCEKIKIDDLAQAWEGFLDASLQRLMQACGAYCFLSEHKGIERFRQYMKPGLSQLATVLEIAESPRQKDLREQLAPAIS